MITAPDPHPSDPQDRLPTKARQWLLLAGLLSGALALLYALFALTDSPRTNARPAAAKPAVTTHVQAPGAQVDARDRWIGEAGNKVAEHDQRLTRQDQLNQEVLARFEGLQKQIEIARLTQTPQPGTNVVTPAPGPQSPVAPGTSSPQGWVMAAVSGGAGSKVQILSGSTVVAKFTASRAFGNVVYSGEGVTSGSEYTISVNGTATTVTAGVAIAGRMGR